MSGTAHVIYGSDPTSWVDVPVPWRATMPIDSTVASYGIMAQNVFAAGSISCTISALNADGSTASASGSQSVQYGVIELRVCNDIGGDFEVCPWYS